MILLPFLLSLSLLLAIGPAIEITFKELLVPRSNSSQNNLKDGHLSTAKSDVIPISNSMASNNECSTGWYVEGYSFPIESEDYDGKGNTQTITIHSLNDTNNAMTRILNSEFLQSVQIKGWGLTKQGDYIGSSNDQFWGPILSPGPVLGYPLVVGITNQTDGSLIPYVEIFTIPTLQSPWNTTTFIALVRGSNIEGRQVSIFTGVGSAAEEEEEAEKITGLENILCTHEQISIQECNTGLLPISTQVICDPDFATTTNNISTGVPAFDQFDSYIINATSYYNITDNMIVVKSMISQESSFNIFAVSPDIPCGVPDGWTDQESRSFGLMQITPACVHDRDDRPNLIRDMNSPNWATSWFNPQYNINRGVKYLADNLLLMKNKFPGCTSEQYTLMALGAYNSGEIAIYGCGEWNDRADQYITNVTTRHRILSQMVSP